MNDVTTEANSPYENPYIIRSVDKALVILDFFCEYEYLTALEVTNLTGYGKSTTFRMLTTLENRGYLMKDEQARYRLGMRFFSIRSLMSARGDLASFMRPYLTELASKTGETAHFAVSENDFEILYVDCVPGTSILKTGSSAGFTRPMYATASGRVILAAKTDEFIRNYLDHVHLEIFTQYSFHTIAELQEELQSIRELGYAINDERYEVGLTSYAVTVVNSHKMPVGAMTVSGPCERLRNNKEVITNILLQTAKEIAAQI